MLGRSILALALTILATVTGCSRSDDHAPAGPDPVTSASAAPSAQRAPLVLAQGVKMLKAGDGDVAALVRSERERAAADGRDLIVYVGATWCEPCQHFHHAAERGELDTDFPTLSVLEFDLDRDRDRLAAAGYSSNMIPLFVLPAANGRASERRFSGSVKGDRAVSNIAPRLRSLLAK